VAALEAQLLGFQPLLLVLLLAPVMPKLVAAARWVALWHLQFHTPAVQGCH
jgi:hypothetical protein